MDIAQRIKEEREKRGIKQVDMANFLNIERSNYTRLENRGSKLTLDQITSIASAIGISPAELLGLESSSAEQQVEIKENEKNKEIDDLKKRVSELEDRIKDKESIMLFQEGKLNESLTFFEVLLDKYTLLKAKELGLNLSNVNLADTNSQIILKPYYDSLPKYFLFNENGINYFLTKEELKQIIAFAFEKDKTMAVTIYQACLIGNNKLDNLKYWQQGYEEYKLSIFRERQRRQLELAAKAME
jgi:transcriptional regulator with XRE-family HTH domain